MHWVIGEVGAKLLKAHAETQLLGKGRDTLTRGICFTDSDQHFDNTSNTHHAAVETYGDILFKGALRDVSRLGFEGVIKVDHGAQRTDSYLTMNTLFLSEGARANSVPRPGDPGRRRAGAPTARRWAWSRKSRCFI